MTTNGYEAPAVRAYGEKVAEALAWYEAQTQAEDTQIQLADIAGLSELQVRSALDCAHAAYVQRIHEMGGR
jgi:hypothetical protein